MPRGLSKIRQSSEEAAARRAAFDEGGTGLRRLTIKNSGESVKVRFLESGEDVWSVYTHKLPAPPGREYGDTILCLDQDNAGVYCPACARNVARSERVTINAIWFDAPKWKRDAQGKIVKDGNGKFEQVGVETVVATWECSMANGGRLDMLDTKHGGLTPHIFEITRRGVKKDTTYDIDLDAANVNPTPAEVELFKGKPDPRKLIKLLTSGDMDRAYSGGGQGPAVQPGAPQTAAGGVFAAAAAGQSSSPFGQPSAPAAEQPSPIKSDVFGA